MSDLFDLRRSDPVSTSGSTLPRPEAGAELKQIQEILGSFGSATAQVRVLGPLSIRTFTGPVEGGIRAGSLKLAALLAVYHARGAAPRGNSPCCGRMRPSPK